MMKHISLDIVRVTEAAAIAASAWVGSGDKLAADKAATDAMRTRLNATDLLGIVRIGEGKKDGSFGLFAGDWVGCGSQVGDPVTVDIAVDPVDGTTPTVNSGPEAMSVIAVANHGAMYMTEDHYMLKMAVGPDVARAMNFSIDEPLDHIVKKVSIATNKPLTKIVVCMLNRQRHTEAMHLLREMGVRIKLIQDCDVSGAISTCLPESGIDLYYGVGGAPEAVITAAAIKCLRGHFEAKRAHDSGNVDRDAFGLDMNQLVKGECCFAATGITNGSMLRGVRYTSRGPVTNSVVMRSESGTVRWLETQHGN